MHNATTRVAIAAFLHDLGKLAERARIEVSINDIDGNKNTYCPKTPLEQGSRHTHVHAAYTGLAWDQLEATGHFPDLRKNCAPFKEASADGNFPDSAVNAAAAHHRPDSFLQWIIATADRVASGFERDQFDSEYNHKEERPNHYCARLLTLFEQIGKKEILEGELKWRYPLEPLSPQTLFPRQNCTPATNAQGQAQYRMLWDELLKGLQQIPKSHRDNLPLWLDHFDALWLSITHAIPAATAFGVKPEVSLYDHSKATAALATALWRWHNAHQMETVASLKDGWNDPKFLLIQGDFFGIQNFIFAEGGQTNKHAHKLLRGRSFQVALLAECAALKLLEILELPPTSQIINAAGKFLIVAPNTKAVLQTVEQVRQEFNDWCLQHTYGEIGIGLAVTPACCNDFSKGRFKELQGRLFVELDAAKHRRFNLCDLTAPAVFDSFLDQFNNELGVCKINGRYPADVKASAKRGYPLCQLADDQIRIGETLTKSARVLITKEADSLPNLSLTYFGWQVAFVPEEELSGKYGQLAFEQKLVRCWDFDLPEADGQIFHGYARRFVNSYVPRFAPEDAQTADKYGHWEGEVEFDREPPIKTLHHDQERPIKTLHHIACEDRNLLENGQWRGEIALLTLKGDVDNLGVLFQQGLEKPTFAKLASLSRQVNMYFALWLPWFCEHGKDEKGMARYRNTYTVFAGGDDFFLIGPWQSTISLAGAMQRYFAQYMVNENITYSAGMVMTQPKVPARQLARAAEAALEKSKAYATSKASKNAATLWRQTVSWSDWHILMHDRKQALSTLLEQAELHGAPLSSGMIYSLLQLADKAENDQPCNKNRRPEDSLWRSQLAYRTSRFITDRVRNKGAEDIKSIHSKLYTAVNGELADALSKHRGAYRLPLSVLLYGRRE